MKHRRSLTRLREIPCTVSFRLNFFVVARIHAIYYNRLELLKENYFRYQDRIEYPRKTGSSASVLERFRSFRKDIYREKSRLVKMEIKLDFTGPDETIFSDKANCKILKESKLGMRL